MAICHHLLGMTDQPDPDKPTARPGKPPALSPREARLAKALRVNLRRRKEGAVRTPSTED
jgi:hypothetical protein